MKTDWKAIAVERADAEDVIREIKQATRRVVDPNREMAWRPIRRSLAPDGTYAVVTEMPVPISRRRTLRAGKSLSPDEGGALAKAKRKTTLLCTIRAAARGRVHASTFLRSPELLEEIARTWRSFAVVEQPAPAEATTEIVERTAVGP